MSSQPDRSIVINGTSTTGVNAPAAGSFVVKPIRSSDPGTCVLHYNKDTGEITYTSPGSGVPGGGTVTSVGITSSDGSVSVSGGPITGSGDIDLTVSTSSGASTWATLGNKTETNGPGEIALGYEAASYGTAQGSNAVAIGSQAGSSSQQANSVAIGNQAGQYRQQQNSVAIGHTAGYKDQYMEATAVGNFAGSIRQRLYTTAIGSNAGMSSQQSYATAVGYLSGETQQGHCIAIGYHGEI